MKIRHALFAGLCLLATGASLPAFGQTDPSFLLTGTAANFGSYFPSYLANGYFSTMTSPRGTEPDMGYMVAFMDYAKGDIARPAAIPGWSEIDYNPGGGWLNATRLDPKIFAGYTQTLNMHDGTLSTGYRFDYANKSTDVQVTTFVSQADPHLAATRLTITPQFDGKVQLTFPFRLWSEHQPRFPIATMTGDEMINAVIASGQNLQNKPVPTPDRAAVWYPGHTRILASDGDAKRLLLWLDGQAEQGLHMAEAAAIGLPAGIRIDAANLEKGPDKLSLNLTVSVQKGKTYTFTKYIAASRQDWGGDAKADVKLAEAARDAGFEHLLARHVAAWHALWKADIVIDGDPKVQQAVHSDLYYLLSNTTVGTAWPMGACALTPGYAGHAFWDSDSWVFPALLLLHPERAKPIVMFRDRTMQPARARAKQYGAKGTMYPWEADPQTGVDNTPHFAYGVFREIHVNADIAIAQWQYYLASGDKTWLKQHGWPVIREIAQFWVSRVTYDKAQDRYEIHVNADIAIAQWQYYLASGDKTWLKQHGWPVIREIAEFWKSRVSWNARADRYEIFHVTSPDEAYDDVPNDSFTNAAARKALEIADKSAAVVGATPDPKWAQIAAKMYIPFDQAQQRHLDFDASVPHDKITWMGSSLVWLMYPNLDLPMTPQVRRNDFAFQLQELKTHGDDPNEMMMVMLAVGEAELGDGKAAGDWIQRNLVGFLKPPFNVRTETVANNAGYILATSAGFVQSFVYGLSGLRIEDKGLIEAYPPVLPPSWKSLSLRHVSFRGKRYDIDIHRDAGGKVVLTRKEL